MTSNYQQFFESIECEQFVDLTLILEPGGPSTGLTLCGLDKSILKKLLMEYIANNLCE